MTGTPTRTRGGAFVLRQVAFGKRKGAFGLPGEVMSVMGYSIISAGGGAGEHARCPGAQLSAQGDD